MTLQDYIKLAEATQKLMPIEPAFHYHVEFHNASMEIGPAMAKALIEAEEALDTALQQWRLYHNTQNGTNGDLKEKDTLEGLLFRDCAKALSQIQALNGEHA